MRLMRLAMGVLLVVLLAGCGKVTPATFQVGDCISIREFDHSPYRITAVGSESYEVEFIDYPGRGHDLQFKDAQAYKLSTVNECWQGTPHLTNYEFAPDQRQELIGHTIVMVARGWSAWPFPKNVRTFTNGFLGVHDHRPPHNDYPFLEKEQPPMSFDLGPTEYGTEQP